MSYLLIAVFQLVFDRQKPPKQVLKLLLRTTMVGRAD